METYYIKKGKYYIQETEREGYFNSVLNKAQATEFSSMETLESYVEHDLKLNLANITVEIETVHTIQYRNVGGSWLDTNEIKQCPHCMKWFALDELYPTIICKETGVELYCADCKENANELVGEQLLDEMAVLK